MKYIDSDVDNSFDILQSLIYDFFNMDEAVDKIKEVDDIFNWVKNLVDELKPNIKKCREVNIDLLLLLLIGEQATRNTEYADVYNRFSEIYRNKGKVFDGRIW